MATDLTKLACSIEFDDEWIQEDCHWKYDRIFTFIFKTDGTTSNERFYYKLKSSDSFTEIPTSSCTKVNNTYYYRLRFSELSLATLKSKRDSSGSIIIETKATAAGLEAVASYTYDYVLPPSSENLNITLTRKSADNIICSWTRPEDLENNPSVAGYSIELFCKKKGADTFVQYKNLGWAVYPADYEDETLRGQFVTDNEGRHKLTEVTDNSDPDISVSDILGERSFKGIGSSYELRTGGPEEVSFYFRPRDFDIQKDDFFMIKVCPYVVYGSYLEGGNFKQGTLLTSISEKNSSDEMEFKLGVVRVRTEQGWVEGQVWVMTADGWKEADSIYTKTATGWEEAQ